MEGLLGIANVISEVLPFLVMCDSGDIGSMVDLMNNGAPSLFIYDKYPGGIGFAQRSFDKAEQIFQAALELISACSCEAGCPSCVGSPLPPNPQLDPDTTPKGRIPDKEAALVILHDLLEIDPYIPAAVTSSAVQTDANQGVPQENVPYPPLVRLPDKVEQQLRQKLAILRRKK